MKMVSGVKYLFLAVLSSAVNGIYAQTIAANLDTVQLKQYPKDIDASFTATSDFLDAALSSLNAFNSLVKKENYRTRIASFNNPTSSDMGFSLENEIQTALKPLLAKSKNTNPEKFSQVVSSLLSTQNNTAGITPLNLINPVFPSLMGLVGNLTINEKRITRQDLDSFISNISRYFVQYEKLNLANLQFDQNIERINGKLKELQFDVREYMMDMILVLHPTLQRSELKKPGLEELFLKYLEKSKMEEAAISSQHIIRFPADGIKGAKEISSSLQKIFSEYQWIYTENYRQIRNIVSESKTLGKNINLKLVENSLKEIEELYQESQQADIIGMRLTTLEERLKKLVSSEQTMAKFKN